MNSNSIHTGGVEKNVTKKKGEEATPDGQNEGAVLQDWSNCKSWVTKDDGYVSVRVPGRGNVAAHRLVMERELGRWLEPHETINHIDGNRSNNHIDNLETLPMDEARKIDSARRAKQARTHAREIAAKYRFGYDDGYRLYFLRGRSLLA